MESTSAMPQSQSPARAYSVTSVDLCHPIPDLQSLQGAYVSNIEHLEEQAERMSSRGSDIGEEIRRLQQEQKLSESRKSSILSVSIPVEETKQPVSSRSRNASTSSYTNSIVDVNNAARWGGYSPGGFVNSPIGSPHSGGSFSQPSSYRQRSGSRVSRLGQIVHTEDDYRDLQTGDEQTRSITSHHSKPMDISRRPSNHSGSSFSRTYDSMARDIQDGFEGQVPDSYNQFQQQEIPDRPQTAASTDTYQQAGTLFTDFDGVHCEPVMKEESVHASQPGSRNLSMMAPMAPVVPVAPGPPAHPLPTDNMVFYPAPVPKMLNLPKRLSQLPAANVQAKRRTKLLDAMSVEARKSMAWPTNTLQEDPGVSSERSDPRRSRMDLSTLPPQLRASAFFDHAGPAPEYELKGESAAETLDNILDASAHAPVSAFTDHPIAGQVGHEVYGKEKFRHSSATLLSQDKVDVKKKRNTMNFFNTRRNSSGDALNKLQKRNSTQDLNMVALRETTSRMSLSGEFEGGENGTERAGETTPTVRAVDAGSEGHPEAHAGEEYQEVPVDESDEPQYFGAPTTLLAELQLRKQQQKSRNRTAVTAFPNGMHSTLLELDAVAEIEKKKRHNAKVTLAWEAHDERRLEHDDQDEDVPLGLLYPATTGGLASKGDVNHVSDWDRPLGLIAQRALDDSEPLSKRRDRLTGADPNRLRGISPSKSHTQLGTTVSSIPPQPQEVEEEEEETLAQRIRRLKNREALDSALGDVRKSTVSSEFATELLGQLGAQPEGEPPKPTQTPGNEEEETLGQRRARLQAEALARGDRALGTGSNRPFLKSSSSKANVMSVPPVDDTHVARNVSNEKFTATLPQGSLLYENERNTRNIKGLWDQNRISSYGSLDNPLLNNGQAASKPAPSRSGLLHMNDARQSHLKADMMDHSRRVSSYGGLNKLSSRESRASRAALMDGSTPLYTPPFCSVHPTVTMAGQPGSYFPASTMGMVPHPSMAVAPTTGYGYPAGTMMPPPMASLGMNNVMYSMPNVSYQQMHAVRTPSMGQMPMQMGMSMQQTDASLDPRQRAMIDQWRQGVMPTS